MTSTDSTISQSAKTDRISVESLIALNEEMIAFSKSGMPISEGFRLLGHEQKGNFGQLVSQMADELEQGQDLAAVIAKRKVAFPAFFPKIISACRGGQQFEKTLGAVSETAKRIHAMEEKVRTATYYPIMIMVICFVCMVLAAQFWFPIFLDAIRSVETQDSVWIRLMEWLHQNVAIWSPLSAILMCIVCWLAIRFVRGRLFGGVATRCQHAVFAEVLSLGMDASLPLHVSICLAGESTGNQKLCEESHRIAQQIENGEIVREVNSPVPSYLGWIIKCLSSGNLPGANAGATNSIAAAADHYRQLYEETCDRVESLTPVLFTLLIGGTSFVMWLLFSVGPWHKVLSSFWEGIS